MLVLTAYLHPPVFDLMCVPTVMHAKKVQSKQDGWCRCSYQPQWMQRVRFVVVQATMRARVLAGTRLCRFSNRSRVSNRVSWKLKGAWN